MVMIKTAASKKKPVTTSATPPSWPEFDAFLTAQERVESAFEAFNEFKSRAPCGSQKTYNKWMDANYEKHSALEQATVEASEAYFEANNAMMASLDDSEGSLGACADSCLCAASCW